MWRLGVIFVCHTDSMVPVTRRYLFGQVSDVDTEIRSGNAIVVVVEFSLPR